MKRFHSILTAVGFACSLLTAFPVYAEENQAFNPYTDNFLIVVGTRGDSCVMKHFEHSRNGYSYGTIEVDADFACGDILTCNTEIKYGEFLETPEFEKVGTYEEYFSVKEMKVTRVSNHSDYLSVQFTDSNGQEGYFDYDKDTDYPFNMENVREGDVYTVVCYSDTHPLFPVEQLESGFNWRTDDFYIVIGTKGDSTVLESYHHDGDNFICKLVTSNIQGLSYRDMLNADFEKVNIYDQLTKQKNLTVISVGTDMEGVCVLLEDQYGNTYSYDQEYISNLDVDYSFSMAHAELGDTYVFEFYDECLVAPVEKFTFNPEKDWCFIVTGKDCIHLGSTPIRTSSVSNFSYGDVLILNEDFMLMESYPCQIHNKNDFEKVGTCDDFFDVLDLTLTSVELEENPDYWQNDGTFYFVDSDGNEYTYYQDYASLDYGYNLKDAQVGEVYPFYCRNQRAVTPVLPTPDGDANGDGTLDILDVITVNKAILGKAKLPSTRTPYVDFNADGVPDATDSLTMLKMLVEII